MTTRSRRSSPRIGPWTAPWRADSARRNTAAPRSDQRRGIGRPFGGLLGAPLTCHDWCWATNSAKASLPMLSSDLNELFMGPEILVVHSSAVRGIKKSGAGDTGQ